MNKRIIALMLAFGVGLSALTQAELEQTDYQDPDTSVPETGVYKTRDANGNLVFTDKPPKNRPVEKVVLPPVNTVPPVQRNDSLSDAESVEDEEEQALPYDSLTIVSPSSDDYFGDDINSVGIAVELEPALQENFGHTVELLLNGEVIGSGTGTTVELEERGTYTVGARVLDADGEVLINAQPVSFYLRRTTVEQFNRAQQASGNTGAGSVGGTAGAGGAASSGGSSSTGGAGSAGGAGSVGGAGQAPRPQPR